MNSVIKRKFGDAVRSRLLVLQKCEPAVKGLVYNLIAGFSSIDRPIFATEQSKLKKGIKRMLIAGSMAW
ncbi:MAG: hypothetical protein QXP27_08360 [Candidatus Methanomethyliaceae archaeon]